MYIKNIYAKNFKSFDEINLNLGSLNYVVGVNASGKSNFISVFSFLKNISLQGLDNAISMEGIEYLRNRRNPSSKHLEIGIKYTTDVKIVINRNEMIGVRMDEGFYEFSLRFIKKTNDYKIIKDNLKIKYKFYHLKKDKDGKFAEEDCINEATINVTVDRGRIKATSNFPPELKEYEERLMPAFIQEVALGKGELLLENTVFYILHQIHNPIKLISIYDFDSKQQKKAALITGKTDLEKDGSNLPIVLKNILDDKDRRRQFINLVSNLLPFVGGLDTKTTLDKSLLLRVHEEYDSRKDSLPAYFISDGTINIISIITALYFSESATSILEEPERNIHPYLASRLVDMFNEVSEEKQLIITTHSAEIVRHAKVEELLLLNRDNKGFSTISRPSENEEVKTFLENELGLDELFVQNIWG